MPNLIRKLYGAAICEYEFARRQVKLRVAGPLTSSVATAIAKDVSRLGEGVLAKSIYLDCRAAAIALTFSQMCAMPESLSPTLRLLPIAIVPPPGSVEMYREFAWEMARIGLLRGIFPEEPEQAQAWAFQKATPALALHCRIQEAAR